MYSFEEKEKYNFDLFTNQDPGQSARPASRKKAAKARQRRMNAFAVFKTVLTFALCGVMLLAVVYKYEERTAINDRVSELKADLEELCDEERHLKVEFDRSVDLRVIEQAAITRLGMTKLDASRIEYITADGEDTLELALQEDGGNSALVEALLKSLSAIREYID